LEAKRTEEKVKLGPQTHSKLNMPKVPGSSEHFIMDEINKIVKREKKH
jgi:hypothetical protein